MWHRTPLNTLIKSIRDEMRCDNDLHLDELITISHTRRMNIDTVVMSHSMASRARNSQWIYQFERWTIWRDVWLWPIWLIWELKIVWPIDDDEDAMLMQNVDEFHLSCDASKKDGNSKDRSTMCTERRRRRKNWEKSIDRSTDWQIDEEAEMNEERGGEEEEDSTWIRFESREERESKKEEEEEESGWKMSK